MSLLLSCYSMTGSKKVKTCRTTLPALHPVQSSTCTFDRLLLCSITQHVVALPCSSVQGAEDEPVWHQFLQQLLMHGSPETVMALYNRWLQGWECHSRKQLQ
jgi:hypothetical protein